MSTVGILLGVILLGVGLTPIIWPFTRRDYRWRALDNQDLAERQCGRLQMLYEQCIASIRDLDDDHGMGKIDAAFYQRERQLWIDRAAAVLNAVKQLDTGAQPQAAMQDAEDAMQGATVPDDIEAMIDRYKDARSSA